MSNNPTTSQVSFSDDSSATFLIRWRGRQEGPYTAAVIEAKLSANQIGLLHEIAHNGQWVTLRNYLAEREVVLLAERRAGEEQECRAREDAERQAKEKEDRRRADVVAEDRRKAAQLEADRARGAQGEHGLHPLQPQVSTGSSGLRSFGILLLVAGLAVGVYFFLAFDASVESGSGRVVNLGLMADRQNGIIVGIGLGVVGTIMLAIGSRGRN